MSRSSGRRQFFWNGNSSNLLNSFLKELLNKYRSADLVVWGINDRLFLQCNKTTLFLSCRISIWAATREVWTFSSRNAVPYSWAIIGPFFKDTATFWRVVARYLLPGASKNEEVKNNNIQDDGSTQTQVLFYFWWVFFYLIFILLFFF